jgi:hypothetical protein
MELDNIFFKDVYDILSKKEKNILNLFYKNKKDLQNSLLKKEINKILTDIKTKIDSGDNLYNGLFDLNNLLRFKTIPKFNIDLYDFKDKIDNEVSSLLPNKKSELDSKNLKQMKQNIVKYFDKYLECKLKEEIEIYSINYNLMIEYGNSILKNMSSNNKFNNNIIVFRAINLNNISPLQQIGISKNTSDYLYKFDKGRDLKNNFNNNFLNYKSGDTFEDMGFSSFYLNPFAAIYNKLQSNCCILRLTLSKKDKYTIQSIENFFYSKKKIKAYHDDLDVLVHPCCFKINNITVINNTNTTNKNKNKNDGIVLYDISIAKYIKTSKLKKLKIKN